MTREEFFELISSKDTPIETIIDLAKSEDTPGEFLVELARYRKWEVRYEVACNPKTPDDALDMLAEDRVEHVWRAVAGRCAISTIPYRTYEKLGERILFGRYCRTKEKRRRKQEEVLQ